MAGIESNGAGVRIQGFCVGGQLEKYRVHWTNKVYLRLLKLLANITNSSSTIVIAGINNIQNFAINGLSLQIIRYVSNLRIRRLSNLVRDNLFI